MLSTLEKAGRVLRLFTAENPEWGVSQVARALNVSKGSAHDALATLTETGLVHRMVTGRYRLGFMIVSLHAVLMAQTPWRHVAQDEMEQLAARIQQTVTLSAFDGGTAICVAVTGPGHRAPHDTVGAHLPAYAAAAGKAMLAYRSAEQVQRVCGAGLSPFTPTTLTSADALTAELARIRETGYAVEDEELLPGRSAVAAPFRNANGEVIAAVTVSAPTAACRAAQDRWMPELLTCVKAISDRLGHQPHEGKDRLHWHLIDGEERLMRPPGIRREP